MPGDDMHRFVAALMRYCIILAVILAVLLAGVAVLLICRPGWLMEFLRYGIAALCIAGCIYIVVALLRASFGSNQSKK